MNSLIISEYLNSDRRLIFNVLKFKENTDENSIKFIIKNIDDVNFNVPKIFRDIKDIFVF